MQKFPWRDILNFAWYIFCIGFFQLVLLTSWEHLKMKTDNFHKLIQSIWIAKHFSSNYSVNYHFFTSFIANNYVCYHTEYKMLLKIWMYYFNVCLQNLREFTFSGSNSSNVLSMLRNYLSSSTFKPVKKNK